MNIEIDSSSVFDQLLKDQVIYVVDKNFNIVFASEGAIKLFEELSRTSESPIGTKCYESFRRRDTKCKDCRAESLLKSESDNLYISSDIVCKQYNKDGETFVIHHLLDSKSLDWMGKYSKRIINAAKESIVVTDLDGIVIEVNSAFEHEMGYTAAEVIGKPNKMFYMDAEEAKTIADHINKNGKLENYKTDVITKDKRIRNIELNAWIANKGEDGIILRVSKLSEKVEVLKSMIKITENILTAYEPGNLDLIVEETAKLLNSKYCAIFLVSDDNKKLVLQAAHDSEYMKKAKDITYDLNWDSQTDDDFDGITSTVAVRKHVFEATNWNDVVIHPAHKGKTDKIYLDRFYGKDFENEYAMYMIPLILGEEVKGVFRIEQKKDASKYSGVDKEIFELMGKYAMIFLKEQMQLRKTVLEHIAHLTRSPIAEAITILSLFSDEETLGKMSISEFTEAMRLVKNAIMQANNTINNLIVWSTDSSKMGSTPPKLIRVKEIISKITRSFEVFTPNVRFKVNVRESDSILLSTTEQIKLEIILQNVVHNSIKYSQPHTHCAEINISGKVSNGNYNIKVRDYGVGMSKEDLSNVWKAFYKGDSSKYDRDKYGSVRGLGIGLASIEKMCTETGWRPKLYSKIKEGTTFVLEIPMRRLEYE